jgi:centromeric protein E
MGAIAGEELSKWEKMNGVMSGCEEKILVLLRLRPLSEREISANESADWECINDTTILYRNTLREGSTFPSAYTFGKRISILNLNLALLFLNFVYRPKFHFE